MGKLIKKLTKGGKSKTRKALASAGTAAMAAVGRKSVRSKANTVKRVAKKAARAGLTAGAMAAAGVIIGEVRKPS